MKLILLGIIALTTINAFADSKIVYNSITACVEDVSSNLTLNNRTAAKEYCLKL